MGKKKKRKHLSVLDQGMESLCKGSCKGRAERKEDLYYIQHSLSVPRNKMKHDVEQLMFNYL